MPNHFLHFNYLLGKTVPKMLVTYGIQVSSSEVQDYVTYRYL